MISIRQTLQCDVITLCELQKEVFKPIYETYHDAGSPYLRGADDIYSRLNNSDFKYFTILNNGEIVGWILYKCKGSTTFIESLNEGEYYLLRIYIKPDYQCRGIGKQAILLCEKELVNAKKFYVDFPKELNKNRKCYENAGFYSSKKEIEIEHNLVLVLYEKTIAQ